MELSEHAGLCSALLGAGSRLLCSYFAGWLVRVRCSGGTVVGWRSYTMPAGPCVTLGEGGPGTEGFLNALRGRLRLWWFFCDCRVGCTCQSQNLLTEAP